jgi:hypothetical protein
LGVLLDVPLADLLPDEALRRGDRVSLIGADLPLRLAAGANPAEADGERVAAPIDLPELARRAADELEVTLPRSCQCACRTGRRWRILGWRRLLFGRGPIELALPRSRR